MKNYIAIVRYKRNGNISNIKSEYKTKKDFRQDLKGNGYRILAIFTEEQIDYIKNTNKYDMKDNFLFSNYESIEYIRQCL